MGLQNRSSSNGDLSLHFTNSRSLTLLRVAFEFFKRGSELQKGIYGDKPADPIWTSRILVGGGDHGFGLVGTVFSSPVHGVSFRVHSTTVEVHPAGSDGVGKSSSTSESNRRTKIFRSSLLLELNPQVQLGFGGFNLRIQPEWSAAKVPSVVTAATPSGFIRGC